MTEYVKFISETEIQYPTAAEFPGVVNWQQHDAKLREKQYFPLTGKPEPNADKILKLDTFALHTATKQRKEAYQVVVEDYEEDPETHEKHKVGEHMEWRERMVEVDDSTVSVESYHYEDDPKPEYTIEDYQYALEEYVRKVREDRGWTTTDPRSAWNSSVERYAQDARDFTVFYDAVNTWALDIINQYASTGIAPCTLDEFIAHLHTIKCNWTFE